MSGPVPLNDPSVLVLLADIERERVSWRHSGRGIGYDHDDGRRLTVEMRRVTSVGLVRRCNAATGNGGTVELTSSGLFHLYSNVVDHLVGVMVR